MPFVNVPLTVGAADDLLEAARTLVDASSAAFIADGKLAVSCRAGCSACCSQAVPITPAEVRSAVAAVERLPEDRRTDVIRRVGEVFEALGRGGVSPAASAAIDPDDVDAQRRLVAAYFHLDQPCPLLHDGVCSIREDRPLACREYLVTSDPIHCGQPGDAGDDGGQVVRIRSRSDVRSGFAAVSASFGEPDHRVLVFALAEALFGDGPPKAPASEPRSGPRTAAMLTPPLR